MPSTRSSIYNSSQTPSPSTRTRGPLKPRDGSGITKRNRTNLHHTSNILLSSLPGPFSQLRQYAHIPLVDVSSFVNRSVATRQAEIHDRGRSRERRGKIGRPCNAFMLYRMSYMPRIEAYCRRRADSSHNAHISSIAGASWRQEPDEVRAAFAAWAEQDKAGHRRAFPGWKYSPSPPRKYQGFEDDGAVEENDEDEDEDEDSAAGTIVVAASPAVSASGGSGVVADEGDAQVAAGYLLGLVPPHQQPAQQALPSVGDGNNNGFFDPYQWSWQSTQILPQPQFQQGIIPTMDQALGLGGFELSTQYYQSGFQQQQQQQQQQPVLCARCACAVSADPGNQAVGDPFLSLLDPQLSLADSTQLSVADNIGDSNIDPALGQDPFLGADLDSSPYPPLEDPFDFDQFLGLGNQAEN